MPPNFDNGTAMNLQSLIAYDLNTLTSAEIGRAIAVCILQQRTGNQNEKDGATGCLDALFEIRRIAEQRKSNEIQAAYLDGAQRAQQAADTQLMAANKINESIRYAAWATAFAALVSAFAAVIPIFK